ncbi:tRNA (adenosine(37)-N6)-threonylcarbamoyltransferase complex ATPase subunit type 1 TsaE [Marinisporobacter balticus]|uniref:tRNA threonylcarbamoyladenosine biosynthesis protein TsaE n=1 Tax=Marinisporobacter balticus TaxID=2018667 RepID=A0A4R2KU78_9FIRM|nr:tRNA (adenosine(37)-N6)-threonylcarbamoyltransferase complex ATPase subunit type 1 TsaE [Marinisporobacter balticus]TCO76432.1 tRNA threonylcarbamoyladenosine biosynthesis protein TsaE [Marinisporobacter balticus]
MEMISNSERKTYDLGYKLGTLLKASDVVCLTGDLGAGKTAISKAIAKGLEVGECVTSPTFTIIHEYEGRVPLYHFDVYRIGEIEEMEDLGYEEYFYGEGVCLIEWASQIRELIPKAHLWIHIKKIDENTRKIEITGTNHHFEGIIEELKKI